MPFQLYLFLSNKSYLILALRDNTKKFRSTLGTLPTYSINSYIKKVSLKYTYKIVLDDFTLLITQT